MTDLRKFLQKAQSLAASVDSFACGCVGPQDGLPLCPCQMRTVQIVNGRYVRAQDFGPVRASAERSVTQAPSNEKETP